MRAAMRVPVLVALPLLLPHPSAAQDVDWKGPIRYGIRGVLKLHYERRASSQVPKRYCAADDGDLCFGGDHEDIRCLDLPSCRWPRDIDYFADQVMNEAGKRPGDAMTVAQAVYALTRLDRHLAAATLANECEAAAWWCQLVLGMALHRSGAEVRAELHFRAGLRDADPELACRLTAIDELVTGLDERVYNDLSCEERTDFAERFWWLADPLLTVSGNPRWTEHVNRRFELLLHEKLAWTLYRKLHPEHHEATVVRRGFEDSWSLSGGVIWMWTSIAAARYRFTPVSAVSEGLQALRYDLESGEDDEGYTPTGYGPFFDLPAQFARFRNGDSTLVAAAAQLDETPLDPTGATFFASEGPDRFPVFLGPVEGETRPAFISPVPSVPLVVGIEAIDERGTVARARQGLLAFAQGRVGLSDPLLTRASGGELPDNREDAVASMRGTTTVDRGNEMVVYWEVYGFERGAQTEVSVSVVGTRTGLLTRILRALGARAGPAAPVVSWMEPVSGPSHPMAVAIDIRALEDGVYDLKLAVAGPDGSRAAAERRFEVDRR